MKAYKNKRQQEKQNLERILSKSDKIISYFYNACTVLSKSIGKILHHLLLNLDYDPKDIVGDIVTDNINKLYEWITSFEKNEYLKKRKIFRKMQEKINFYKKIEIQTIKDAYSRLASFLKQNNQLAERGEFSILNATNQGINTVSRFSFNNRSMFSNRTNQYESVHDDFNMNILDELNTEKGGRTNETLTDLLCRFQSKLNGENLGNMPPVLLNDFIKKFKNVTDNFYGQILKLSLGIKPDNNILGGVDNNNENFVQKNYDYHKNCIKELQSKVKYLEKRFNIVNLMLESRNLSEEEMKSTNIQELNDKNKEINEEDFEVNMETKNNVQLISKMEEYFNEKKKIFEYKKKFMEHIRTIKDDHQNQLSGLFDELNKIEDDYTVSERAIENLQISITLNQEELRSMQDKLEAIKKEEKELKVIADGLDQEIGDSKKKEEELKKLSDELKEKIAEKTAKVTEQLKNIQSIHNNILQEKLTFYENREKITYMADLHDEASTENERLKENRRGLTSGKTKNAEEERNRVTESFRKSQTHRNRSD